VLLTITTTRDPATDLGFLLHKHPEKAQSIELSLCAATEPWSRIWPAIREFYS